ncbi:MAG: hypothetical protein CMO01_10145 [Thalassobius sp.]|nr:hypothetical protein [Thalassovita sp.]
MSRKTIYEQTSQLLKEHQWEEVIQLLSPRVLEQKEDWKLYWNAGWANYKKADFAEAVNLFTKACKVTRSENDEAVCLTFIGIAQVEAQDYQSALENLMDAVLISDSNLARKSLAMTFMKMDDLGSAEKVHQEGLKLKPNDKERLAAYGNYLMDTGRYDEADEIKKKIEKLA